MKEKPVAKTALVVDDSKSARYAMRKFLEHYGYAVDTAESAQDAYVYLQRRHPGVIFLDHQMRGCDGFEVLSTLKESRETAAIPVVICSASESETFLAQARQAGAAAVLPKPPSAEQVSALLRRLEGERGPVATPAGRQRVIPQLGEIRHREESGRGDGRQQAIRSDPEPGSRREPAPVPRSSIPTSPSDPQVASLERRIESLQAEIDALRRLLERRFDALPAPPTAETLAPVLVPFLAPALRRALEPTLLDQARRAAAQSIVAAAERMAQEGRKPLDPAAVDREPTGDDA